MLLGSPWQDGRHVSSHSQVLIVMVVIQEQIPPMARPGGERLLWLGALEPGLFRGT